MAVATYCLRVGADNFIKLYSGNTSTRFFKIADGLGAAKATKSVLPGT